MAILYLTWINRHSSGILFTRQYFSIITINEVHLLNNDRLIYYRHTLNVLSNFAATHHGNIPSDIKILNHNFDSLLCSNAIP